MNFHDLQQHLSSHFQQISLAYGTLFTTDANKDDLWNLYLDSFPARINPIYRKRREFDCSCCRNFIREIGGVVFIDEELNVHTLWEFHVDDPDYQRVLDALDGYVKSCHIVGYYLSTANSVGTHHSHEADEHGNVKTWEHFYLPLPASCRYQGRDTLGTVLGDKKATVHVFDKSLREISSEAIDTVLDLISSDTLYRGAEWQHVLELFLAHKNAFDRLPPEKQVLYPWAKSGEVGSVVGRLRNHSIGVLLTDITSGIDLNEAVARYERIVAPANYKRPKAIFTARMLEEARKTVDELGYTASLQRRHAKLDDITVNNILFANRDAAKQIINGDVFGAMLGCAKQSPKHFDRIEEIPIEKFLADVLPKAREIEAYVENRHATNMVSLIAPVNKNAPSIFKWDNPFGWAYSGNMTDSDIRRNVKAAGGNVDGVLRFSIQWNDMDTDLNDLDAHCKEPDFGGEHIYFSHKRSSTGGELDIDIINPTPCKPAVENITWPAKGRMAPGEYRFFVHCYTNRGGRGGFRAEIAFDGKTYSFNYDRELRGGESVPVATVTLERDGTFKIRELLPSAATARDLWGIKTMQFVPVSVIMLSPNYWDGQTGIGNKHYFFMLNGCVNPERPNGFYNEFLKRELEVHKRVFEALGSKLAVAKAEDQLSGLGFSSTLRNELVVKVKGATERTMKIKF